MNLDIIFLKSFILHSLSSVPLSLHGTFKISELYNSDKYKVEFKLESGDLLMMDNHRLLHGRTKYDVNEGDRYLQGCYIDFDSTEGKLRHLKRKFNL